MDKTPLICLWDKQELIPQNTNKDDWNEFIIQQVRKWGDLNTDAILSLTCQIFMIPTVEGLIGYQTVNSYAIVYGEPVCSPNDQLVLAQAFHNYCATCHLQIIYTMVSENFKNKLLPDLCSISLEFGKKFILDPKENPIHKTGSKSVLVRKKVKRATQEGVVVKEYNRSFPVQEIEKGIEEVATHWLKGRKGPQIHIGSIALFSNCLGKRWFYAEYEGKIIGFLILNQVEKASGWLLNHVMMLPHAPNGTSELLVVSVLQALEEEGKNDYIYYGPIPASQIENSTGMNRFSLGLTKILFKIARHLFRLDGHGIFWEKFQTEQKPCYLLFEQKTIKIKAVLSLMRALNARI